MTRQLESKNRGSCWIPGSWISQCHTIRFLRPASFLNSLFFMDLLNELSVSDAQWRIRPWNPIRAYPRLLLDSRVVNLPMAYNPTFVILSSLKPLFFNSLKNELRFLDNAGA